MSTENQISLISNPQEFTRLYNAILKAEHGDNFLAIDDDRPDRGNDGYLKSENRIYAGHCFKRVQNQSLDSEIRRKMVSDLKKAIALKKSGDWQISAWTFISNYPIAHDVIRDLYKMGRHEGIDVAWRGPADLADLLQRHPHLLARFPILQINQLEEKVSRLTQVVSGDTVAMRFTVDADYRTPEESDIDDLIRMKPHLWEFSLFSKLMEQDRAKLTTRLLDHEMGYAPRGEIRLDGQEALARISDALDDVTKIFQNVDKIFAPDITEKAFGRTGERGNVTRISHLASRIVGLVDESLSWSATLRSLSVPTEYEDLYEEAARFVDQPISDVFEFIDDTGKLVDELRELEKQSTSERPVSINRTLRISVDQNTLNRFHAAIARLRANRDPS